MKKLFLFLFAVVAGFLSRGSPNGVQNYDENAGSVTVENAVYGIAVSFECPSISSFGANIAVVSENEEGMISSPLEVKGVTNKEFGILGQKENPPLPLILNSLASFVVNQSFMGLTLQREEVLGVFEFSMSNSDNLQYLSPGRFAQPST